MAEGERATGTPNTIYDLASVLFHALEGGASYDQYIQDAEEAGDDELADFFRRVRDEDSMRADEAQLLLAERTLTARTEGELSPTRAREAPLTQRVSPRPEPSGDLPGTEPIEGSQPPRTEPISAPPGPGDVPPRRTEEILGGAEEAPPPEEQRRAREREDRTLVDEVLDRADEVLGRGEQRREGTDRGDRR